MFVNQNWDSGAECSGYNTRDKAKTQDGDVSLRFRGPLWFVWSAWVHLFRGCSAYSPVLLEKLACLGPTIRPWGADNVFDDERESVTQRCQDGGLARRDRVVGIEHL
jgi:hypothetical protein